MVEVSVLFSVLTCQLLTASGTSVGVCLQGNSSAALLTGLQAAWQPSIFLSFSSLSVAFISQRISYCGLWYWHKSAHPHCTHFSRVNGLELGLVPASISSHISD